MHDEDTLAASIVRAMEQKTENAPPEIQQRSTPGQNRIRGVLKVCAEQTSKYDWFNLLYAVAAQLSLEPSVAHEPMEAPVFRGLALLLPYVQTLPEDREIYVNTNSGLCTIVVWAHHLLGLNVIIKKWRPDRSDSFEEVLFGK